MSEHRATQNADVTRGVIRWGVRETIGLVVYVLLLFLPAGTWNWPMGWALIGLTALWIVGTALVTIPRYPELLAERVRPNKGAKTWDTAILGVIGILMLVKLLLAGFDMRYMWTVGLPQWLQLAGAAAALLGYALVIWATASNAFFSQVVHIQTDRGQTVATGGPYRFVRHPSYIGMIAVELGSSLMLGSWLALIPGIVSALLFILRTRLEDQTLLNELDGYKKFAAHTRYRLIPGVW